MNRDDPQLQHPKIRVLPPVRHGALFDTAIGERDTLLIIDGVYHQAPALRHKEILHALDRGVRVIGAASIGALRAAELSVFGMLGVGSIYSAYANGDLDGDGEVAVAQAPTGDLRALSWPMVNLRHIIELAQNESVVETGQGDSLLYALSAVHYSQRSAVAVRAVCREHDASALWEWLKAKRERDPHFGDLKRRDAQDALRIALGRPAEPARTASGARSTSGYLLKWANSFVGEPEQPAVRLAYQQLFDPDFPAVWLAYLQHRSGPAPLDERITALTAGRCEVPAYALFHPVPDLRDAATVRQLLGRESAADRAAVLRYTAENKIMAQAQPGFTPAAVSDEYTRHTLRTIWGCPAAGLDDAAWSRGLNGAEAAVEQMKTFMVGFLTEPSANAEELGAHAH
nr:TfuA-like protein [Streptomyces sp. SID10853]